MKIENLLINANRQNLREWLIMNSTTENCCWVVVSISKQEDLLLYLDAVEESLCFGWVDGIKKKNEHGQLMQRLSPRKKNSNWTELNRERVRRLDKLNLMTEPGYKVLPNMNIDDFKIDGFILSELSKDQNVLNNFNAFPELYKRVRLDTIMQAPDAITYYKRVEKLIENTKKNKMYGQWNDNGRLENY